MEFVKNRSDEREFIGVRGGGTLQAVWAVACGSGERKYVGMQVIILLQSVMIGWP